MQPVQLIFVGGQLMRAQHHSVHIWLSCLCHCLNREEHNGMTTQEKRNAATLTLFFHLRLKGLSAASGRNQLPVEVYSGEAVCIQPCPLSLRKIFFPFHSLRKMKLS